MKAPDFIYARAATLDDAFKLKAQHGADAKWLAGGQSLLASLAFRLAEPPALIDISGLAALRGIARIGDVVRIGGATTYADIGKSDVVRKDAPLIADAMPHIAHAAIRNKGTIGGSLAFADPAAELPACVVALGATIVLASAAGERRVPAREFFQGVYATACKDDELILAVEVPAEAAWQRHALVEVTRRSGDYAMSGLAAVMTFNGAVVSEARLVFFAAGDRPMLARAAGAALVGQPLDIDAIDRAAQVVADDIDPSADLNGSVETKRHMARVVLRRALNQIATSTNRSAA